jgi:hypothetical protein
MNTEDNFTEMCMMVVSDAIDVSMFVLYLEFTVVIPCPVSETQVNWPDKLASWYKILTEHSRS